MLPFFTRFFSVSVLAVILALTTGPALAQTTVLSITAATASQTGTTGSYVVPSGGPYKVRITARGAQGGNGFGGAGGAGATMVGEFILLGSQTIEAIAGARGSNAASIFDGGGGGGSGVRLSEQTVPLVLAGGGSGSNTRGSVGGGITPGNGKGGGGNGAASAGGGGGGLFSNGGSGGTNGVGAAPNGGGAGFGGLGGFGRGPGNGGNGGGGYGGGGGGNNGGGAGGGGYSGGNSINEGGFPSASGSINYGTSQTNTAGNNNGGGQILVELLGPAAAFAPVIIATQPACGSSTGSLSIDLTGDFNNSTNSVEYAIVSGGSFSGTPSFTTITAEPLSITSGTGTQASDGGSTYTVRVRLVYNPTIYTDYTYTLTALPTPGRLYVNAAATGLNTGLSWADAFTDLQSALQYSCASNLTEIWVARGIYKPTTGTDRSISFSMKNGVAIYGGFVGDEAAGYDLSLRNFSTNQTTLSGDIGTVGDNSDNSYHVISNGNLGNTAVLDGFVITGGNANDMNGYGGGMYNTGSSPIVSNCTFQSNTATEGAGMYNNNSSLTLTNCSFLGNSATLIGGGILNAGSSPGVSGCSFQNNTANLGGGLYNQGSSSPVLTNCSFQTNSATVGGGIYTVSNNNPTLINCSFQGNQANQGGGIVNAGSTVTLTNCVLFRNGTDNTILNDQGSVSASYSLFESGVTGFTDAGNNITGVTTSPFASTTSVALNACAAAIDAGSNSAYTTASGPATDLAGNPRFYNEGRVDMGAYEFQGASGRVAITAQPVAGSAVCVGGAVTASVSVSGTGPFTYKWYKDGSPLSPAQSTSSLSLNSLTSTDAGSYSVVITNTCNSLTSTAFSLTVNAPPTSVSLQPSGTLTCAQTSVVLSASATGGTSYTLLGGGGSQTSNSGSFTVSQAGAYTVTVSNASGCTATATATVSSNTAVPTNVSLQSSGTLTCAQTSVTLTASATGGTSYTLTNGITSQSNTTGEFVVSTAGSYTVTVANDAGCTATATAMVSSNTATPMATLTASSLTACAPASITLTASGGTSYTFSAGAAQIGTTNQAIVTQSGTYSVTVSNASGCTATASTSVTVNTPPAAPTLTGVSRTVNASSTPLPLSQFMNAAGGNTLSFSGVSGLLNPPVADIRLGGVQSFSVSQTSASGCVSGARVFSLSVVATPASQTVCRSSSVVLSAATTGVRYEWYKNGQSIPFKLVEIASIQRGTATSSLTLVSIQTTASYYVKVFQANNSFTFDGPFMVTVNYGCIAPGARVAAGEVAEVPLSVVLTPNPVVNGQLRALVTGAGSQPLTVQLLNLRGQVVREQSWSLAEETQPVEWDVRSQATGTYLLTAQTADQRKTIKVIKAD